MSDQILMTDCFFLCSLSSFPSSFHIFGCDPAEPGDSLLLNAAAHQSTPGSSDSSMLLPGINKSRRGAFQTSPVLIKYLIQLPNNVLCLLAAPFVAGIPAHTPALSDFLALKHFKNL